MSFVKRYPGCPSFSIFRRKYQGIFLYTQSSKWPDIRKFHIQKRTLLIIIFGLFFICNCAWFYMQHYIFVNFNDLPCDKSLPLPPVQDRLIFRQTSNFDPRVISGEFGSARDLYKFTTMNVTQKFQTALSKEEKLMSLFILQKFINICEANNIEFFISAGTVLGVYRHHGFIPWDDDLDVFVNRLDRQKLRCALENAGPHFGLSYSQYFQWKFFYKHVPVHFEGNHRWPFIDIFFYLIDGDSLFDVTMGYRITAFDTRYILPPRMRIFEGGLVPTPCNPRVYLNQYGITEIESCFDGGYSHRLEWPKNFSRTTVDCKMLYNLHPFVFRRRLDTNNSTLVEEQLWQGNKLLHTYYYPKPCS